MSCCKSCEKGRTCEKGSTCDPYPEYRDSEVLGGRYWPAIAVEPLTLAAGQSRPVDSLSDVRRTMLVNVIDGVAHVWFRDHCGRPFVGGDDPHLTLGVQPSPHQFILPPGQIRLIVGAGDSLDLVACVTLLDRDPHGGS